MNVCGLLWRPDIVLAVRCFGDNVGEMLFLLTALACSQNAEPKSFEIADVTEVVSLSESESEAYAMKMVTSALMANPLNNDERAASVTTSHLLVLLTRDETAVSWSETLCGVSSTETFGNLIEYPAAFIETMPARERSGTLSSTSTGASFSTEVFTDVNGALLDDPESDPLPEEGDSTAFDQDEDGEPGISLSVTNTFLGQGEVYAAQRRWTRLTGEVVEDGRIEGYVDTDAEESILGASTSWLTIPTPAPIPDPEPTHSYFILQRLSGDAPGCDDVWDIRD